MNLIILLINIYFFLYNYLETENESNKSQIKNEKKSTNGSNHQQNGNCKNNSLKIKNDVIAKFFYFIKKLR